MLELIPINQYLEENVEFASNTDCRETLLMTLDYYKIIGFVPPWIGYFARVDRKFVGSAGYKGRPEENKIEIAYGTFPDYWVQGIGTEICRQLVLLAQKTDPKINITARTLAEHNYSTRILQKNGFRLLGDIWDMDDGNVWEWQFEKHKS